jgi:hypothetical protein
MVFNKELITEILLSLCEGNLNNQRSSKQDSSVDAKALMVIGYLCPILVERWEEGEMGHQPKAQWAACGCLLPLWTPNAVCL